MTTSPLTLDATPIPGGVGLKVRGASPVALSATFTLEVTAGSNRSVHRGTAMLQPGEEAILSTISVSTGPSGVWEARLRVEPSGADPYEQVERSR